MVEIEDKGGQRACASCAGVAAQTIGATPSDRISHQMGASNEESQVEKDEDPTAPEEAAFDLVSNMSLMRETLFVAVICLSQFTTQVGLGQTLSILHILGNHLLSTENQLSPPKLAWITAGYSLTVGSFVLISGRLGDYFGYKRMLIIGLIWFSIWSMIAGLAPFTRHKFVLFIFARVLQGIGPSICLPNGLAILGAIYRAGKRKDMVFAFFAASAPCGSITGAAFGSLFSLDWWPWAFYSFSLVLAAIAAAGTFAVPDIPSQGRFSLSKASFKEMLLQLDLLGATVGVTALVLFNFAWNQAPIVGWRVSYVYATLISGALVFAVFVYIELHVSPFPLLPIHALNRDIVLVLVPLACGWASFGIWFYYTFQTFELFRNGGSSPLLTTAMMVPEGVSGAIAAVVTGFLLSRLRAAWVMTLALVAFTLGTTLISTAPVDQTYWGQTFFATIVMAWGMDMSFPSATVLVSNAVRREHQGIGASLVNTVVNYSISIGLGFAGTVEVNINDGGQTDADLLRGFRGAYYIGLGFAGAGLLVSLCSLARSYVYETSEPERP